MKKLMALIVVFVGCFCLAQDTQADFPNGIRVVFSDGTSSQFSCTQDGNCRVVKNTSASSISRINLGFNMKHGYVLNVQ